MDKSSTMAKAGWRVKDWCRAVSIARSTFYAMPCERQPKLVHIGSMVIITEQPDLWIQRVGTDQRQREEAAAA